MARIHRRRAEPHRAPLAQEVNRKASAPPRGCRPTALLPVKFRQAVSIARAAVETQVRNPLAIKRSENAEERPGETELPKLGHLLPVVTTVL